MSNYLELEYIEASGAQYIDTGYKPNNNTRLEVRYYALSSARMTIAACDSGWQSNGFGIWQIALEYGSIGYGGIPVLNNTMIDVTFEKGVFSRNDGTTYTFNPSTFQTDYNMYLFALNRLGSPSEFASQLRMYKCRIFENGTLIKDFVPCIYSNNIGMWDKVNNVFHGNQGSGSFIAGNQIVTTPSSNGQVNISSVVKEFTLWYANISKVLKTITGGFCNINGVLCPINGKTAKRIIVNIPQDINAIFGGLIFARDGTQILSTGVSGVYETSDDECTDVYIWALGGYYPNMTFYYYLDGNLVYSAQGGKNIEYPLEWGYEYKLEQTINYPSATHCYITIVGTI